MTLRRSESARDNGRKSSGPKTEEGLRRCREAATRHGLFAKLVLVPGESEESFSESVAELEAKLRAADGVELGLVEEMASASWRLRRLWAIESRKLGRAMERQEGEGDALDRLAESFSALAPELGLIDLYERRLHRMYARALRNLAQMREWERKEKTESKGKETEDE